MKKILIIDDDKNILEILHRWLSELPDVTVHCANSDEEARIKIENNSWDLVITDVFLEDGNGLDTIQCIRKHQKHSRIILISGNVTTDVSLKALNLHVDAFLQKPLDKGELQERTIALLSEHQCLKVLAIGAHPDDVEIGCGGTLARHAEDGDDIAILTLSRGEKGGAASERAVEAQHAASLLQAELMLGCLEDTKITAGPETIDLIQHAIKRFQPDIIYTHSAHDAHQDHRNVFQATMIAARRIPQLECYQSPSSSIDFRPSRFADIAPFIRHKQQLVQCYDSQLKKCRYLKPSLIEATAEYWGRFCNYGLIEPFEVIRSV